MWLGMNLPRKNEAFSLGGSWVAFCYFPRLPGEVYQCRNKWWERESGWSPWNYQPCFLSSTFLIYTLSWKHDKCSNFPMILFLEIQQSLQILKLKSLCCLNKNFCCHWLWRSWLLPKLRNNMNNKWGFPPLDYIFLGRKISFFE